MHLRLARDKIELSVSGAVHETLGGFRLPSRLDCLLALWWLAFGNWGVVKS